jgi:hypothetical protein
MSSESERGNSYRLLVVKLLMKCDVGTRTLKTYWEDNTKVDVIK